MAESGTTSYVPSFHITLWVSDIKGGTRLRVFDNRELRRIFGPKMDEVKGGYYIQ
jgi:hypothetical protein